MNITKNQPIIGYPFAAPLSGKDTVQKGLVAKRPHIAVIHMSSLLDVIIQHNEEYKNLRQKGGLLPAKEAVKAFRRGFIEITHRLKEVELPHIFANGACREEYETKAEMRIVRATTDLSYQQVGFRFLLDKEHILSRAEQRIKQAKEAGNKPRKDDLGSTPVDRYNMFQTNLGPVLKAFEKQGGIVIDIDANQEPEKVLHQVISIYDYAQHPMPVIQR
jgi:hypothetical protein